MAKNLALTVTSPAAGTRLVPCDNIASVVFTSTSVVTIKYVSNTSTAITFTSADATYAQHNLIFNAIVDANMASSNPSWALTPSGIAAITTIA